MQQSRSRAVIFIAIAVAIFFFIDPFSLFEPDAVPKVRLSRDRMETLTTFLTQDASPAVDYVVSLFDRYDIVFIGESGFTREQVVLIADLIPALDRAGVHALGFQHALRADQQALDELVTATTFDEAGAHRILFNNMVILGYQEYVDVLRAAWQVNRRKTAGEEPFLVIGLNVRQDYSVITAQGDVENPEIIRQVFAEGVPDQVMAETIRDEFLDTGTKALIFTQQQHAFTSYRQLAYEQNIEEAGFPGQKRAGAIVEQWAPDRTATVLIHGPVPESRSRIGYSFPAGGAIDSALQELPEETRNRGFMLADSPFAEIPIYSSVYSEGYEEDLLLADLADGYVTLDPIGDYEPLTPIPGFITAENLEEAKRRFPGPDPGDVTAEDLNTYIADTTQSAVNLFKEFE